MDKEKTLDIIKSMQKAVEQMKNDDLEDSPESATEYFPCQCCGEEKILAGSLLYNSYLLCNECVLVAEISFALNKIKDIDELINQMEDKRFENLYNSIFEQNENTNN